MPKKSKDDEIFDDEPIIIDQEKDLIFDTEEEVLDYFKDQINQFEKEYLSLRKKADFSDDETIELEGELEDLLQTPDEIWQDAETYDDLVVYNYIRQFAEQEEENQHYYVAVAYLSGETPTFIFLHFPSKDEETVDHYRRGEMIYDRTTEDAEKVGIEGDALSEGDELAIGLYKAMLTLRADSDIPESLFLNYSELREESIEEADEIWRNTTISGYTLVTFIKDFSRHDQQATETLYYIAVTIEDESTNSHALLFSFPTSDETLVDRYRHGENLQADEIIQESSH